MLYTAEEEELDPRLCPSYVYGFSFEKKKWCKFFVDSISAVDWKPNALESLILPPQQKRLLQGLVTGHKFPDKARDEHGLKGKGLVVLLHGSPGSGKTLTAEMTAEHTRRALLNISTGELGSYQYRIEYELKRLLTYASTFQAIVKQTCSSKHENPVLQISSSRTQWWQSSFVSSNISRVSFSSPQIASLSLIKPSNHVFT